MSELVWVAVPNGLVPNPSGGVSTRASVRVLVVPRLTGVDIGEDGLQDWPSLLEDTSFTLWTSTSLGVRIAPHRPRYVARARSEVWTGFFGGDAGLVEPFSPTTNPVPTVAPTYTDARRAALTYRSVSRVTADPANDSDAAIRSALSGWSAPEPPTPRPPTAPASVATDFHATVARLREHPTVLLELGLIFEVVVDVADLAVGDPAAGRALSVRCDDPQSLVVLVSAPWTRYDLDLTPPTTGFWPGAGSGVAGGRLDLSGAAAITAPAPPTAPVDWAVATFEIDGVVGSLRQAARELPAAPAAPAGAATMPAIRSAGLALLRPGRGLDFAERVGVASYRAKRAMADAEFAAPDLVLGYRVDIRRGSGPWRSLCWRDAAYAIDDLPIGPAGPVAGRVREEGHVKAFAATRDASGELHADEVVLRWNGWSLAVPLPNLRGDTDGPSRNAAVPLPFRFDLDFAVPAERRAPKLPTLRFANLYRMRVRIADVAGGGPGPGEIPGNAGATEGVIYRRHDPVLPPRLRDRGPFAPGAAVDRLVVRSDPGLGLTPEQLHTMDPDYPLIERRTLDPPTTSLQVAEAHGVFDPPMTDERSFLLAQRAMDPEGDGLPDPAAAGVNAVARLTGTAHELADDDVWSPPWPDPRPKAVELRPHSDPSEPVTLGWSAGTLRVTAAPARQAVIDLSSTIVEDRFDHLEVFDHLLSASISGAQTVLGRNPVVSPARPVEVVHAVRRPLATPRWSEARLDRAADSTEARLNPTFAAATTGLGLDTHSTGRLVVSAAWTEVEDVGDQATIGQRPVTVAVVHSQAIDPGPIPAIAVRHEFGDTRYRAVTYTVQATSRFRPYFKDSEREELFQTSFPQQSLDLLSTVRPRPPEVLGVGPGFSWRRSQPTAERIEHVRRSQRVRVELARPWFTTGAGEQLAVVLAPDTGDPSLVDEWVSRAGRDPLFGTPATPSRPTPAWFAAGAAARRVTLPGSNRPVTVVPVDVVPAGDRWYADIEFAVPAAAASYNCFVRLAVARYQNHSLEPLTLSPVVVLDPVPLLPDRAVVLARSGNRLSLSVSGLSPQPLNRLEAILESCGPGVVPENLEATVDDVGGEPGLAAWRPVPGGTVVRSADGTIPPLTLASTPGRLRVRLRESEDLPPLAGASPPDLARRTVFVDTVVLPAAWST